MPIRYLNMSGKTINYQKSPLDVQKGLDASRRAEWKKWLDFGTGVKIQGKILDELLQEGLRIVPTQCSDPVHSQC